MIDRHAPPVGIPAHVPTGPAATAHYFFVTLEPSGGGPGQGPPLPAARSDSLASGCASGGAPSRGAAAGGLGRDSSLSGAAADSRSSSLSDHILVRPPRRPQRCTRRSSPASAACGVAPRAHLQVLWATCACLLDLLEVVRAVEQELSA